jgi:pantothenate kinase
MAPLPQQLIARVEALLARGGRVLGIAGAPGAGKSTLTEQVVAHFGDRAELLPMDSFHLANEELTRLGRAARKGAPDTFDIDGYLSALRRVRAGEHDVLVPRFHREVEEAFAGAIRIATTTALVVTEGNYLLLQRLGWADVAPLLDESWFLRPDDDVRRQRLIDRHIGHGRSPQDAVEWVRDVDEPNAVLIERESSTADVVIGPDSPDQIS